MIRPFTAAIVVLSIVVVGNLQAEGAVTTGQTQATPSSNCTPYSPAHGVPLSPSSDQTLEQLVQTGQAIRAQSQFDNCKLNEIVKQNRALAQENRKLRAQVKELNKNTEKFKARKKSLNQRAESYQLRCTDDKSTNRESLDCGNEKSALEANARSINIQSRNLMKNNKGLQKAAKNYSEKNSSLRNQYVATYANYKKDLSNESQWLNTVVNLIGKPNLAAVRNNYGCPDFTRKISTSDQLNGVMDKTLICLTKATKAN